MNKLFAVIALSLLSTFAFATPSSGPEQRGPDNKPIHPLATWAERQPDGTCVSRRMQDFGKVVPCPDVKKS